MTESNPTEPLWKPEDLAAFLQLPEKTLRKWRSEDKGPPWRKIGRHVRYDQDQVRAWLAGLNSRPYAS